MYRAGLLLSLAACTYVSAGTDDSPGDDGPGDGPPDEPLPPALRLQATAVDLGAVPLQVPSFHGTFQVENVGDVDVPFQASISGAFSLQGSTCTGTLAAHTSCTLQLDITATTFGPIAGTLTVSADRLYNASVAATPQAYVSTAFAGQGTGTIHQTDGTPCFMGTCYPDGTTVSLQAVAGAGSHFAGWSDPSCLSSTCQVTAGATPVDVTAQFDPGSAGFDVIFDGGGPGQVGVQTQAGLVICDASCSVPVDDGAPIEVAAATPVDFGGFAAPCPAGQPTCQLAAGTTSLHVDFHHATGETTLPAGATMQFDEIGDSVVTTTGGFDFHDATGAIVWSRSETDATLASSGDVYVLVGDELSKYTANGTLEWAQTPPASAVSPTDANLWFSTGATTWQLWGLDSQDLGTVTADRTPLCWTTTPDGQLYVGVHSVVDSSSLDLEVFDATGTRQADQLDVMPDVGSCVMASDWDSHVLVTTTSLGGETEVARLAPGGGIATINIDASPHFMGVGADGVGRMAWLVPKRVDDPPIGARVVRVSAAGAIGATVLDRDPFVLGALGTFGVSPIGIAVAPNGRILATLSFVGFDGVHTVRELFTP